MSNGFNTSLCVFYQGYHPLSLVVDLEDARVYVDKVVIITAVGPGGTVTFSYKMTYSRHFH